MRGTKVDCTVGRATRAQDVHQTGWAMLGLGVVLTWMIFGVAMCFVWRWRSSERSVVVLNNGIAAIGDCHGLLDGE